MVVAKALLLHEAHDVMKVANPAEADAGTWKSLVLIPKYKFQGKGDMQITQQVHIDTCSTPLAMHCA